MTFPRHSTLVLICNIALIVACAWMIGTSHANSDSGSPVLLELGWQTPSVQEFVASPTLYAGTPFSGVIADFEVENDRSISWLAFTNQPLDVDREKLLRDAEAFAAADLGGLTHNFLRYNVIPGNVNWLGDLTGLYENAEFMAQLASRAGMRGICFDPEQYSRTWTFKYSAQPEAARALGFRPLSQAVERAGAEFIRAINRQKPDAEILMLFVGMPGGSDWREMARPDHLYSLLPAFIDGMIRGASEGTVFIDGCEGAYGFEDEEEFTTARQTALEGYPLEFSLDPDRYRSKVEMGFGVWLDGGTGLDGLVTKGEERNPRTPGQLAKSVALAMRHADGYVWLYDQYMNWVTGEGWPIEYDAAFRGMLEDPGAFLAQPLAEDRPPLWEMGIDEVTDGDLMTLNDIRSARGLVYHVGDVAPADYKGRGTLSFALDLPAASPRMTRELEVFWNAYGTQGLPPQSTGFTAMITPEGQAAPSVEATRYAQLDKTWVQYLTKVPIPADLSGPVALDVTLFTGLTHYYIVLQDLRVVEMEDAGPSQ